MGSQGNILEDETASRMLYHSKVSSEGISAKQIEIQNAERDIDHVRESYRPVALHAAALYFCVGRLKYLDPTYQFSLSWFINLFQISVAMSEQSTLVAERIVFFSSHI